MFYKVLELKQDIHSTGILAAVNSHTVTKTEMPVYQESKTQVILQTKYEHTCLSERFYQLYRARLIKTSFDKEMA